MSRREKTLLWASVSAVASVLHPLLWQVRFLFFFCPLATFLLASPCPEWCCKRTGTVWEGLVAYRMNPLWVCELLTPTGLKGRESQPRGSGFEASERWRGRKSALQEAPLPSVILLGHPGFGATLGTCFCFALSIGFLTSTAAGEQQIWLVPVVVSSGRCWKSCQYFRGTPELLQRWQNQQLMGLLSVLCWESSF